MIDYICKYAPVEILYGFGEECSLCNPMHDSFTESDKLVHRNICSFSRALIETRIKNDKHPFLLTDCCDSVKCIYNVLNAEGQKVFLLSLPHNNASSGKMFYKNELLNFIKEYSVHSGKEFSIEKFRNSFPADSNKTTGPYIAVIGGRIGTELLELIKEESPLPVRSYTCTDCRVLSSPPLSCDLEYLVSWYADELLSQTPCMRMTEIASRRSLIADPDLAAVIYNTVSFCDYYSFEYAEIRESISVPVLKVETDYTKQAEAQIRTRLDAFFENSKFMKNKAKKNESKIKNIKKVYTAGIDSGSTSTNAVILDNRKNIVSYYVVPTGVKVTESAKTAYERALINAGLSSGDITKIVSTGYGRTSIDFSNEEVTEITCHAAGAYFLNDKVRTIIDIGGQDSKIIRIDDKGRVIDFTMNDKCAAGTGRFLEMMAQSLCISLDEMSKNGLEWDEEITITSMCSVFAQSEVVSLIASNKKLEDIIHGINKSVALKVTSLGGRAALEKDIIITGGVARNKGVIKAIEDKLGCSVYVPECPEICGALGAALIAANY